MATAVALAGVGLMMVAAGGRLDMGAADDARDAPYLVDSRFVMRVQGWCATASEDAREEARDGAGYGAPPALPDVAACERLGLEFAALERQKAWTLPPPVTSRYGRLQTLSGPVYLALQCARAHALVALFDEEAGDGRDSSLLALVQRTLPELRRLDQPRLCSGLDSDSSDLPAASTPMRYSATAPASISAAPNK